MSTSHLERQPETMAPDNETSQGQHLDLLAGALAVQQYPGYPAFKDRLFATALERSHSCRPNIGFGQSDNGQLLPTADEYMAIQKSKLPTDQQGRPIHPWLDQMVSDPRIGVVTGKGFYYRWGPNYTADAVVIKAGHVLLVERADLGVLALPGGFVDLADASASAGGLREVKEETQLNIDDHLNAPIIYQGLVVDLRMTAHAWPETTATLVNLGNDGELPAVHGKDDAKWAGWVPLEEAQRQRLFGSHNLLIGMALATQQRSADLSERASRP
jgi:ADP-ribose pyrophosphatase YjhB (NUDIX family)